MSSIKALEELRGIAERMDDMAAEKSEHGFSPLAISIKNALGKVEAEIAERFMELPLDADGVPIRMGDTVEGELLFGNSTVRGTVTSYHIHDDDEPGTVYIRVKPTKDTWTIKELQFRRCRHVKPDTVESLLDQFQSNIHDDTLVCEVEELIEEYAERIRKVVEHGD